jgi:pyruvate dehydrogenase E1 component
MGVPHAPAATADTDPGETRDWLDSLDEVLDQAGPDRIRYLLRALQDEAAAHGIAPPPALTTPYVNTIPVERQPQYPGNLEIERRLLSIVRWNAMAMVVRANREPGTVGGHISTYASAAALWEVAFHHFLRARTDQASGDQVFFQGHAAPGVYARAFLEGRLDDAHLGNFRRELSPEGGLSSYPHPWLMPGFWQFPSVSMGLAPLMAIYQARFNRYLERRGLTDTAGSRVWAFVGDGEMDEPESVAALTLAARERLDNLTLVVNCNLQRLDGPVRGNGKIIQELEALFRGAGWNVIKVIWGSDWDPLLAADESGELVARMGDVPDGQYQKYSVAPGSYTRQDFFGTSPQLLRLVESLSDEQIRKLKRGGHDPLKIYAAYRAAIEHRGAPTVILAKTIKGYGLGEAGEGRNVTHQQKKLNEDELREFRSRFGIPISDEEVAGAPFYRPPDDSPEMQYLQQRRRALGGFLPARNAAPPRLRIPSLELFDDLLRGTGEHNLATTAAFARMLAKLLRTDEIGKLIVPIIPDEARTFGMDVLFHQIGIYNPDGQRYEPVDKETLLYYREKEDGQLLEEGITEAGAMGSFIAAGTAHATHGVCTIPFFHFYSMFGFQRVGDLIWAAADARARGFLLGCTAGRTTLNGEGLQHQDGSSQLVASSVPNLVSYDPAFAYELAVILQDGLRRMFEDGESIFYYLTLYNEPYPNPAMPDGADEGILRGMYALCSREAPDLSPRPQLLGSGPLLREALRAQNLLADRFGIASDVFSVTSYRELRRDALAAERWNRLHPDEPPRSCHLWKLLAEARGPFIAVSDFIRQVPEMIARWLPGRLVALGTDGFGRSDTREALRRFFEVDAESIAYAALHALAEEGRFDRAALARALDELGLDRAKPDPMQS